MTVHARGLTPVTRTRLHEDIVKQLEKMIMRGDYKPGQKLLTERALASDLRVNRGTLREAMKKLEVLGLVEIRHGDGNYVRDYRESGSLDLLRDMVYMDRIIDPDILRSLLDVRKILAVEMAVFAARNRNDSDLSDLKAAVESDMTAKEKDIAIHRIVARASGNVLYLFLLNFFEDIFRDFGYLYFEEKENIKRTVRLHGEILAALGEKNEKRARRIMEDIMVYT